MRLLLALTLLTASLASPLRAGEPQPVRGDTVIRGKAGPSEIVITTTSRLAGAIHSLTWNGREFIDSYDHGRQLQSAANFDCGKKLLNETYNPTEAGSERDGPGPRSSSRLLRLRAGGAELETVTQMAFWLAPGQESGGHLAYNDRVLSDHSLTKRVRIGYKSLPQVIEYAVTFTAPPGERHTAAVFEALTGYMPPAFDRLWKYDLQAHKLELLPDGQGEQASPLVFSTAGDTHAMGIYSPEKPGRGVTGPTYGRFRFPNEKVNKWNCVFRRSDPTGIPTGDYSFRMFVVVGSLEDVRTSLDALSGEEQLSR